MKGIIVIGTSDLFEMVEGSVDPDDHRILGYLGPEPRSDGAYGTRRYLGTDEIIDSSSHAGALFVVALYDNSRRRVVVERLEKAQRPLLTVVHPSSVVMGSAEMGSGTTVAFNCTISSQAVLGKSVVVRSQAHISHDVSIGDYSFVAPGVRILGGAVVGEGVLLGSNSVVFPGVQVGDGARVGAGMIVTKDVPRGVTVHPGRPRG